MKHGQRYRQREHCYRCQACGAKFTQQDDLFEHRGTCKKAPRSWRVSP